MSEAVMNSSSAPSSTGSSGPKSAAGLQGVVAAPSGICFIDGEAGRLVYRGYEITDLVGHVSFEESAHLLWDEKLPNAKELSALKQQFGASATLPPHVQSILRTLPTETQPMDALRTACSALSSVDPDPNSNERDANHRKAIRPTATFPTMVAAFHRPPNKQDPI